MLGAALERPTLILNRNWQAVGVARVARALQLVWNDSAAVVDPTDYQLYNWADWAARSPKADEPFIQGVSLQLRIPEVVALRNYDRTPRSAVAFNRRNVYKRDHYSCQYCGAQPGPEELTIDHVLPRSRGGPSSWENCVLACVACNSAKADGTPGEARLKLRQLPVRPKWRPAYAGAAIRIDSWAKFLSEAYWNVPLKD